MRDIAEYDAGTGETTIVESIDYSAFGEPLPPAQSQQGGGSGGGGQGGGGEGNGGDPGGGDQGGGSGGGYSSTIDFLFGYTAREEDDDVGLMWYRARWYDPSTGRFVSEDPIGFSAGDLNLSRYVGNGPVNWVDPSGLKENANHSYDKIHVRVTPSGDGWWLYTFTPYRRPIVQHGFCKKGTGLSHRVTQISWRDRSFGFAIPRRLPSGRQSRDVAGILRSEINSPLGWKA